MDLLEVAMARSLARSNQSLTRQEFDRRQLVRFREFAAFVQAQSPYYRRVMRDRGIDPANCVLSQFPVLTKSEAIEHFDGIVTAPDVTLKGIKAFLQRSKDVTELYLGRYTVIHTSGSSGEVGYFVYDEQAWSRGIAHVSNAPSSGPYFRRGRTAFVGATDGHYAGSSIIGAAMVPPFKYLHKTIFVDVNLPMRKILDTLNGFQPDSLVGYGSALVSLADAQMAGHLKIQPRTVANSGEPLLPAARKVIQRAFGPRIRNVYSCSEHLLLGVCEAGSDCMKLAEDELMFELNPDHTLVTNLFNRTMPLIRYRMNDVLVPIASEVHKPYRAVAEIVGRVDQPATFVNAKGVPDSISPYTINELLIPHVRRFQLRVTGDTSFNLAIVLESGAGDTHFQEATAAATARLKTLLAQKELDHVTFGITRAADIPVDPQTRKFRIVVDERSPAAAAAGS